MTDSFKINKTTSLKAKLSNSWLTDYSYFGAIDVNMMGSTFKAPNLQ